MKRIVVFGTESTGKTTLATALAASLGYPMAPEYVRSFWDEVGGQIAPAHLTRIAAGQLEAMARAARASEHVICDTDLLSHVIWTDLLFPGRCRAWVREAAEIQARHTALYLLCDSAIDWTPDPQRCFPEPEDRARVQAIFRQALDSRHLAYVTLRGTPAARLNAARAATAAS